MNIRGSGRSGATVADAGELAGAFELTFDLAPNVGEASFLLDLTTTVDTTGVDAFAVGGLFYTCSPGTWSCILEGGKLPEQYGVEVTSDTLFGNGTQEYDSGIPRAFMPNGRFGGMEMLNFEGNFTIDQALAQN